MRSCIGELLCWRSIGASDKFTSVWPRISDGIHGSGAPMIPLHVKHLETFFWAARLGSFTAAAKRLHSTQSTVSMRISELELRFGVSLFDRSHRKARLTAKGEELMAYTERLLQLTSEIHERIARPDTVAGVVRIGVAEVVAQTWLPRFVEALHRRYP